MVRRCWCLSEQRVQSWSISRVASRDARGTGESRRWPLVRAFGAGRCRGIDTVLAREAGPARGAGPLRPSGTSNTPNCSGNLASLTTRTRSWRPWYAPAPHRRRASVSRRSCSGRATRKGEWRRDADSESVAPCLSPARRLPATRRMSSRRASQASTRPPSGSTGRMIRARLREVLSRWDHHGAKPEQARSECSRGQLSL